MGSEHKSLLGILPIGAAGVPSGETAFGFIRLSVTISLGVKNASLPKLHYH